MRGRIGEIGALFDQTWARVGTFGARCDEGLGVVDLNWSKAPPSLASVRPTSSSARPKLGAACQTPAWLGRTGVSVRPMCSVRQTPSSTAKFVEDRLDKHWANSDGRSEEAYRG